MSRTSPLDLSPDDFRRLGHRLVDDLADFLNALPSRPVSPDATPTDASRDAGRTTAARERRRPGAAARATPRSCCSAHSVFNGHPRFMGYITSSAAPLGSLAELLAATVNPNCGSWGLSPMATLIEEQTVAWIGRAGRRAARRPAACS